MWLAGLWGVVWEGKREQTESQDGAMVAILKGGWKGSEVLRQTSPHCTGKSLGGASVHIHTDQMGTKRMEKIKTETAICTYHKHLVSCDSSICLLRSGSGVKQQLFAREALGMTSFQFMPVPHSVS